MRYIYHMHKLLHKGGGAETQDHLGEMLKSLPTRQSVLLAIHMTTTTRNDQTDNFERQQLRKLGKALRKRDRMLQQATSDKDCWDRSKDLISRAQRHIRTM